MLSLKAWALALSFSYFRSFLLLWMFLFAVPVVAQEVFDASFSSTYDNGYLVIVWDSEYGRPEYLAQKRYVGGVWVNVNYNPAQSGQVNTVRLQENFTQDEEFRLIKRGMITGVSSHELLFFDVSVSETLFIPKFNDADGDSYPDNYDAFPNDASEHSDIDGDGVGDNADVFPDDASESSDTDGDGVGDNADDFPEDSTEVLDSDGDGIGDNADVFPYDPAESKDTDGDWLGDEYADTDDDNDAIPDSIDSLSSRNPLVRDWVLKAAHNHACAKIDDQFTCWGDAPELPAEINPGLVQDFAVENSSICVIQDGLLYCSGEDRYGHINDQPLIENVYQVAQGTYHTCAISDNNIECWGYSASGRLQEPEQVSNPGKIVAAGNLSCAVSDDRSLNCWGPGGGKAGMPAVYKNTKSVDAGGTNVCAINDDGLSCWGSVSSDIVSQMPVLIKPHSVSVGTNHACAIDRDQLLERDQLHCWGGNAYGQSIVPDDIVNPVQVAAGNGFTCVLHDGGIKCWGNNFNNIQSVPSLVFDKDQDGAHDSWDIDPIDPAVGIDSDSDGVADINDAFPYDSTQWSDMDGDGIGDDYDAFDQNPNEYLDLDSDGLGENSDVIQSPQFDSLDSDGDGVGDMADGAPQDGAKSTGGHMGIGGNFVVDASGHANYEIPLLGFQGTGGFSPNLSLVYNSGAGNGMVGIGWGMSGLSSISRCSKSLSIDNKAGGISFDETDRFCLDGQRLIVVEGSYGASGSTYRTAMDSYLLVTAHGSVSGEPAYFSVEAKDGSTRFYGNDSNDNSKRKYSGKTISWSIDLHIDRSGNSIRYTYAGQEDDFNIKRIDYAYGSASPSADSATYIDFNYQPRVSDSSSGYLNGQKWTRTKRLSQIRSYNNDVLLREYELVYKPGSSKSLLEAINECRDNECYQTTTLAWPDEQSGFEKIGEGYSNSRKVQGNYSMGKVPADINGDGKMDLIYSFEHYEEYNQYHLSYALSDGVELIDSDFELWVNFGLNNPPIWGVADINKDGFADLMSCGAENNATCTLYYGSVSGYSKTNTQEFPQLPSSSSLITNRKSITLADINADGLTDFVVPSGESSFDVYYGLRSESAGQYHYSFSANIVSFSVTGGYTHLLAAGNNSNHTYNLVKFIDINNDSWPDLVGKNGNQLAFYLNNGSGFTHHSSLGDIQENKDEYSFVDYNFDGYTDIMIRSGEEQSDLYTNTGIGFVRTGPATGQQGIPTDKISGLSWVDYNNDGYQDFYHKELGIGIFDDSLNSFVVSSNSTFDDELGPLLMDITGDGTDEFVVIDPIGGSAGDQFQFAVWAREDEGLIRNKITSFDNGLGKVIRVDYSTLLDDSVYGKKTDANMVGWGYPADRVSAGSKDYPVQDYSGARAVVNKVTIPVAIGDDVINTEFDYYYEGAKFQEGGRGWLGFSSRSETDKQTGKVETVAYRQDYPLIGQPLFKREFYNFNGNEIDLSLIEYDYAKTSILALENTYYVQTYPNEVKEHGFAPIENNGSTMVSFQHQLFDQDEWGNIISEEIHIKPSEQGLSLNTSVLTRNFNSEEHKKFGLVDDERLVRSAPGAADVERTVHFDYTANMQLEAKTLQKAESELAVRYEYIYDLFGNVTSETVGDPQNMSLGRTTSWGYDSEGRFINQTYNSLNHLTEDIEQRNEYGYPIVISTEQNALKTFFEYDHLGRERYRWDNTGFYQIASYSGGGSIAGAETSLKVVEGSGKSSTRYFDAFGREIAATSQLSIRNQGVITLVTFNQYNPKGQLVKKSVAPCPSFSIDSCDGYISEIEYDDFDRIKVEKMPGRNDIGYIYDGLETRVTNSEGHVKKIRYDARGLVVLREDTAGNSVGLAYSADDQLQTAVLGNTVVNRIYYDSLGRKVKQVENDKGTLYFTYNRFGQIVDEYQLTKQSWETSLSSTSPGDRHRVSYTYDNLGRPKNRQDYREGVLDSTTTWSYDSGENALGQLTSESVDGYTKDYTYDLLGRVDSIDYSDGGHLENVTRLIRYDDLGRQSLVTNGIENVGSGYSGVYYQYNTVGALDGIYDLTTSQLVYRNQGVEFLSNAYELYETLGGEGTSILKTKSDAVWSQIERVSIDNRVGSLEYSYDQRGNIYRQEDSLFNGNNQGLGLTYEYCYDNLNRLIKTNYDGATGCGVTASEQDQEYSPFGNIDRKTGLGVYSYSHAGEMEGTSRGVSYANGISYQYDRQGNMVSDSSGRTIEYSVFNKATRITKDNLEVRFNYGADRKRWKRVDIDASGTVTTYYIGDTERIVQADGSYEVKRYIGNYAVWSHFFNAEGSPYDPDGDFVHAEHVLKRTIFRDVLGSVREISDDFSAELIRFNEWGSRVDPENGQSILSGNLFRPVDAQITTKGYTGHEMVDGLSIIHMNGRIYDPAIGRFLQADPFVPDPTDPQSYNRYSYVRNNPMNRVDPTGYSDACALAEAFCYILEDSAPSFGDGPKGSSNYVGEGTSVTDQYRPIVIGELSYDMYFVGGSHGGFGSYGTGSDFSNSSNSLFSSPGQIKNAINNGVRNAALEQQRQFNNKLTELAAKTRLVEKSHGFTILMSRISPRSSGSSLNLVSAQKEQSAFSQAKNHLKDHVRVGWAASFNINKVMGATIDLGSAKLSDAEGGYWTNTGYVEQYSEGRTLSSLSVIGLFTVSAQSTTFNNGQTWDYGSLQFEPGAVIEIMSGQPVTIDFSIGAGLIYENTFTFGGD